MPTEKAIKIANAFTKYAKGGDKSLIIGFSREDIEATLLQYHLDRGWAHYIAMERRIEELKEEKNRIEGEQSMSITTDHLKKLTLRQLLQLLSVGAWITIVFLFFSVFGLGYKLGFKSGMLQTSKEKFSFKNLTGKQKLLVNTIWEYQKSNNIQKVIINRNGFIFDEANKQNTSINLIEKILGSSGTELQFERLILEIPSSLLRLLPELRLGSPYVVTIPEETRIMLDKS